MTEYGRLVVQLYALTSTPKEMNGQSHAPAALTLCPLNMQLRWSHIRRLQTAVNNKTLSQPGIEPKLLSRQPLAQSSYDFGRAQKSFPIVISMSDCLE